jgi:uncharacterized phiE125 gp8 family phage protein
MSEPSAPPPAVAIEEARAFLRLAAGQDDALLPALIGAATAACEACIGRAIILRPMVETWAIATGAWHTLGAVPVRAITRVEGVPAEGAAFALPRSAYAAAIAADGTGRVCVNQPGAAGRVRVSYSAGLADDAASVPEPLRLGILLHAAHYHRERDPAADALPVAVRMAWAPWRRMRLI